MKLKQLGPLGDEIAKLVTPQEYQDGGQPPQIPPELQQQMDQMQQENAKLKEQADKNKTDLQKTQMSNQADIDKANLEADRELALQVMKNAASIAVAHISANAKGVTLDAHAEEEAQALGHEVVQNHLDRAHEAQMAQMEHEQAIQRAEQGQAHALEQGDQAGNQQMAVNEQQAALQPPEPGV